LTFKIEV